MLACASGSDFFFCVHALYCVIWFVCMHARWCTLFFVSTLFSRSLFCSLYLLASVFSICALALQDLHPESVTDGVSFLFFANLTVIECCLTLSSLSLREPTFGEPNSSCPEPWSSSPEPSSRFFLMDRQRVSANRCIILKSTMARCHKHRGRGSERTSKLWSGA